MATGGSWSSSSAAITVDAGGVVTGGAAGTAVISYTTTNSCGTQVDTLTVTVDSVILPGTISGGTSKLCVGANTAYTDGAGTGVWAVSNSNVTIAGGVITGVSAGTSILSYTTTNTCGSNTDTLTVSVDAPLVANAITGTSIFCIGSTSTLSDVATGGSWSSSSATITVDAGGVVTGGAAGTAMISYTTTNSCGTQVDTLTVTVDPMLVPGTITGGTSPLCIGANTTYTDAVPGGIWSSSNADVSVTGGMVTGFVAGSSIISYTTTNSCGINSDTLTVTVEAPLTANAITGATTFCNGTTSTLSDAAAGGTWSSGDTTIARADASGLVTGNAAGTALISYSTTNSCGSQTDTLTVTITDVPVVGVIIGATSVCITSSTALSDTTLVGTWTSSDPLTASVDPVTGLLTGNAAGVVTISFTSTNGCGTTTVTALDTVITAPVVLPIAGAMTICNTLTLSLSDAATGGTWTTDSATIATIDPVTGLLTSTGGGVVTISYSVTNSCGTTTVTTTDTVIAVPTVTSISGPTQVCQGSIITVNDGVAGGIWSSSDPTIASIDASGNITGIAGGSVVISYTAGNVCGSITVMYPDTVYVTPVAGVISSPATICIGSPVTLTNGPAGGTWMSSNVTLASIDSVTGVVTGVASGVVTLSYTVGNQCGSTTATVIDSINIIPSVAAISGATSVCTATTIALTDITPGGVWSSSDSAVAAIDPVFGVVVGGTSGIVTLSYSVSNTCGTTTVTYVDTVNSLPVAGAISGSTSICMGSSTVLSDTTAGGTWSTSDGTIASVDATGTVTGVATGTATISYTLFDVCGATTVTSTVTVNSLPVVDAIVGAGTLCAGTSIIYTDDSLGGVWSSSDNTIVTVDATGNVTGIGAGSATITYTVTNAATCSAYVTAPITIAPLPVVDSIAGLTGICIGGSTTLTNDTLGGVWHSSDAAVAIIDPAGAVTTVGAGTTILSYTVTSGAGCATVVTKMFTVSPLPVVDVIAGTTTVCAGNAISLSDLTAGGVWTSSDNTIATVDAAGNVTGMAAGSATISYTLTSGAGCSTTVTTGVTVNAVPVLTSITGLSGVCVGSGVTLYETSSGGTWSTSSSSIATVDASGLVTGVALGTAIITYSETNAVGCTATVYDTINVTDLLATSTVTPSGSATLCGGSPVNLVVSTAGSTVGITYQWYMNGALITGATNTSYIADTVGVYTVVLSNGGCSSVLTPVNVIAPPHPLINVTGGDILYTGSFATYQWYLNGVAIPGATHSTYTETGAGNYTVMVTDGNGCMVTSAVYAIVGVNVVLNNIDIKVYPNPATSVIRIDAPIKVNATILSVDGKVLMQGKDVTSMDISELAAGMYIIKVYDENNELLKTDKFVKAE